ncbi:hypothetical protein BD413DRAFT_495190 [Trametes elegans]|nr:hypothetical protein BD413DRAFT_495190 [Trametes elegans]
MAQKHSIEASGWQDGLGRRWQCDPHVTAAQGNALGGALEYEVWISDAHRNRLPEHSVKLEGGADERTVVCYVPSESGKDHDGALYFMVIDGADTGGKLGTIEVRIHHIHPLTGTEPFVPQLFAGVGRTVKQKRVHGRKKSKLLNQSDGPYVAFIFRYRPAALLRAEGVIESQVTQSDAISRKGKGRAAESVGNDNRSIMRSNCKHIKSEPLSSSRILNEDVIELTDDKMSLL